MERQFAEKARSVGSLVRAILSGTNGVVRPTAGSRGILDGYLEELNKLVEDRAVIQYSANTGIVVYVREDWRRLPRELWYGASYVEQLNRNGTAEVVKSKHEALPEEILKESTLVPNPWFKLRRRTWYEHLLDVS